MDTHAIEATDSNFENIIDAIKKEVCENVLLFSTDLAYKKSRLNFRIFSMILQMIR